MYLPCIAMEKNKMEKRQAEKHYAECGSGVRVDAISHSLKRIDLESRRVDVKRAASTSQKG